MSGDYQRLGWSILDGWKERAENAEAEVERLRGALRRIESGDDHPRSIAAAALSPHQEALDAQGGAE